MTTIQPPLPPAPPQAQTQAPVEGEVVSAQIVKLPENLATTDRALTLKGEVIAQNPDGTVRIATPRGPIDVKLPDGQTVQRGQTVEVQIPAGTPPRTVAVTLPHLPQLPPDTPQPLPQPQIPSPQIQTPQIQAPQGHPTHTRLPDTVPTARPPQTSVTTPPQGTSQPTPNENVLSPKGLLEFLKTSLQSALKTPNTPETPTAPQPASVFTQKPLAIGQLARLTPLMAGQSVLPQSQGSAPEPAAAFAKAATAATFTLGATQLKMAAQPLPMLSTPASVNTMQQTPLQAVLQTVLGATVNIGIPQGVGPDPIARLLLPLLQNLQPDTAVTPKPVSASALSALPQLASVLSKSLDGLSNFAPLPHQRPVVVATSVTGPQIIQATDIKVAATIPTAPLATLQNPLNATLLHGTPTAPVMFATVAGQTQQGLPVLELTSLTTLPDGTQKPAQNLMVLQFPARGLAPSTVLRLDVLPGAQPAALTATPLQSGGLSSALPWASIDDALGILHTEPQGQAAVPLLQAALPKPGGAAFTAPVLMFVAAMRGGDVSQWLGEKTVDLLRTTKRGEALSRVTSDFTAQSRENAEAPRGEWKSLTLPMIYGQEITRITLHSRSFERDDETNPGQKKSGTRFVMDISLTRMGNLQIDGLSLDKKLDATLRTEKPLSAAMREGVRARYANALQGIGFAGQLTFNASPDHKGWIDFESAPAQRGANA